MIRNQAGATLIELLAALSIASFIIWGILHINISVLRDFGQITSQTNVRQVADLAMDELVGKLRKQESVLTIVRNDQIVVNGRTLVRVIGEDLEIEGQSIRSFGESYAGTNFDYEGNLLKINLKVELNGSTYTLTNSIYYRQTK
ncbi:PilW family protein [Ammoniphilus sp. YIM 78166]|uniref:PilW family protein n=1 Tax=Ammoniphilus sp. YIM 78166 TaxID=1644106 RepID=UPI00106FE081|nr:prepilin-type N-terminal cleavage/methylation domain-containing protein [Ammoniphilus sp. YIM 78166]